MGDTQRICADFVKLWSGRSISLLGSAITVLALPLIAVRTFGVSPLQMGVLAAAGQAPFLIFSLPAGAWIDRMRRLPVLIAADLASAALLLSIPIAAIFGSPPYVLLCFVAFGIGAFTVLTDVAQYAYVPTLVGRRQLTACNSRLQIGHSVADTGGPGLAGVLIQLLTAPIAVLLDAITFLVSAVLLGAIRKPEEDVVLDERPLGVLRSMRDGLRTLFRHRLLRPIVLVTASAGFFESGLLALYVLYASRYLHLSPLLIGLTFAAGGIGAIPGAVLAERVGARFGVGPTIIAGYAAAGVAALSVPLAAGPIAVVVLVLMVGKALGGITDTAANIHQWTLRQAVTPDRLAGRVTAGQRFIVYGTYAVGAFASGALASATGVRTALILFAVGMVASPLLGAVTALRHVREQPADIDDEEVVADEQERRAAGRLETLTVGASADGPLSSLDDTDDQQVDGSSLASFVT
jgi:MFS family permease